MMEANSSTIEAKILSLAEVYSDKEAILQGGAS